MATATPTLAPEIEDARIELQPQSTRLETLVEKYKVIETEADYLASGRELLSCADYLKTVEDSDNKLQKAKTKAYGAWQDLCSVIKDLTSPAEKLVATIKRARLLYEQKQERQRQEDARIAREAAEADERRRREAADADAAIEAWELEEAGAPADVVELARTMPVYAPPPVFTSPVVARESYIPKQAGISSGKKWTAVVVDVNALGETEDARAVALDLIRAGDPVPDDAARAGLLLLVTAVAAGFVPLEAIEANDKFIRNQATQFTSALSWPGVLVFDKGQVTTRGRSRS